MKQLTRTQENVLYNKLRLIKGQTKQELGCQIGTVKALTSSGFASEYEGKPFFKTGNYFYLNQSLDIKPEVFNEKLLRSIWDNTEHTARSPYSTFDYPRMWKTIDCSDGLVLFSRLSSLMVKSYIFGKFDQVKGISYQFQLDGKWIGQGSVCEFKYFEEIVAPELQSDLKELRRIAKN